MDKQVLYFFNDGLECLKKGRHKSALKSFNQVIKLDNQMGSAYANRGMIYESLGNYKSALKDFNRAISLASKDWGMYYIRGKFYYNRGNNKGNISSTLKDLKYAIKLGIDNKWAKYDAYKAIGMTYASQGKRDEAIDALKNARRFYPQDVFLYYECGLLRFEQRRYEEAAKEFQKADRKSKYPRDCKISKFYLWFGQGLLTHSKGKYKEAEIFFCKAKRLGTHLPSKTKRTIKDNLIITLKFISFLTQLVPLEKRLQQALLNPQNMEHLVNELDNLYDRFFKLQPKGGKTPLPYFDRLCAIKRTICGILLYLLRDYSTAVGIRSSESKNIWLILHPSKTISEDKIAGFKKSINNIETDLKNLGFKDTQKELAPLKRAIIEIPKLRSSFDKEIKSLLKGVKKLNQPTSRKISLNDPVGFCYTVRAEAKKGTEEAIKECLSHFLPLSDKKEEKKSAGVSFPQVYGKWIDIAIQVTTNYSRILHNSKLVGKIDHKKEFRKKGKTTYKNIQQLFYHLAANNGEVGWSKSGWCKPIPLSSDSSNGLTPGDMTFCNTKPVKDQKLINRFKQQIVDLREFLRSILPNVTGESVKYIKKGLYYKTLFTINTCSPRSEISPA